jgi:hypothetical protein
VLVNLFGRVVTIDDVGVVNSNLFVCHVVVFNCCLFLSYLF